MANNPKANYDNHEVTLTIPGLYVFVSKVHPYMLGGVVVNDSDTDGLDIGDEINLAGVGAFPSNSDLGFRLLRAFFIVTSPSNWKDYPSCIAKDPVQREQHPRTGSSGFVIAWLQPTQEKCSSTEIALGRCKVELGTLYPEQSRMLREFSI